MLFALATTATILARKDRADGTVTMGVPPVATELTNTLHFAAIDVHSNSTATLTVAWPLELIPTNTTIDILAATSLVNSAWTWQCGHMVAEGETNWNETVSATGDIRFFKAVLRESLTDMDDPDGDGLPNVYELAHGRNPWVHDYALAHKLTVGPNGEFGDIVSALAESEEYSIIAVTSGVYQVNNDIQMPPHPVMVTSEDGLYDYAEAYGHGTDPFLADSDNDGVSDGVEVLEQTNPNDGLNFCFACIATVSNADALYTNSCCSYLIGQEISAPATSFAGSATVALPHTAVTDGVVPRVVAWIDVNANGAWEVGEPRAIRTLTITNHDLFVTIDLLQVNGDMDGDKMPDVWEVLHGFCPTNNADAFEDADGDSLPNLFEYRCSTNPRNSTDGSNTVYSILARSVDDRIRTKADAMGDVRHLYLDFLNTASTGGDFVPNTNAWTHGLDFSSMGVKSIRAAGIQNGLRPILISDRHVIEATHCSPATNDVIWFRASGGTMYERTIVGLKHCQNYSNDVSIGILNEPLPSEIVPVRFLPENFRSFIWDGERLPTIRINKYSQAVVQEINCIPAFNASVGNVAAAVPSVQFRISDDMIREAFRANAGRGDSGHANYLVAGGSLIFLFPTHSTNYSQPYFGTSCLSICLKNEIETMMNELCAEHGVTNLYSIQQFDFSSLTSD